MATLKKMNETILHLAGIILIHCETLTIPITGTPQLLKLLDDDSSVLFLLLPGALQECVTTHISTRLALRLAQVPLHLGLGCNASVVSPW